MKKGLIAALPVLCILAVSADAGEKRRQLGAHEHGHGALNIAIEGKRVVMELEAPAADIVGFEHAPRTKAQKAAVAAARSKLSKPLALFVLPPAAGCKVVKAAIEQKSEEKHEGGHSKGKHKHDKAKHHKGKHHDDEETHSEFHATYELTCSATAKLSSIDFAYFKTFKAAEELEVKLITPKGQKKFEATRKAPRLSLGSLI